MLASRLALRSLRRPRSALVLNRNQASTGRISQIYGQDVYPGDTNRKVTGKEADLLAQRLLDWAVSRGAQSYNHYFHPIGLNCRTGGSDRAFLNYDFRNERPIESFSGTILHHSETDGSSFPNGGMRSTHTAAGYLIWDGVTPPFVKDSTLFLPSCFYAFTGEALDEKIPLLRATDALNRQALRLLRFLGDNTTNNVYTSVGCEQEFFLMNRDLFMKRPDLVMTGRTLLGATPVKGQQLEDHYFGTVTSRVHDFFDDLKRRCWAMGVPIENAHHEVAPGQFEVSPIFQRASVALDTNMLLLTLIHETARDHNMAALMHEKPFAGVNGSGKHNNWSVDTNEGVNLLRPGKTVDENIRFMVLMTSVIRGVSEHSDLLRLAVAVPGNDHRLGACEAPPGIMSMYTGEHLLEHLEGVAHHNKPLEGYSKLLRSMNIGVERLGNVEVPTEDRNRTSPFPFVGNRFEFRAVGSSQSPGLPQTMLAVLAAEGMRCVADEIETRISKGMPKDKAIAETVRENLRQHLRIIFNGDGYSQEWVDEAARRGIPNISNSVDASANFASPKNIQVFSSHGVFTEREARARCTIMKEFYAKQISLEARQVVEMARKHVLPAAIRYGTSLHNNPVAPASLIYLLTQYVRMATDLSDSIAGNVSDMHEAAEFRDRIIPLMTELRNACDNLERIVPASEWSLPTYDQMLHSVHY